MAPRPDRRPCSQGRKVGRGAFTLIELLVVIAIIAILVAIIGPALARARESSRAAKCLSNQRQIGIALQMYANAYREMIPREGVESFAPQDPRVRLPWPCAFRMYLDERCSPNVDLDDKFVDAPYYKCPSRAPGDRHQIHYVDNGFAFILNAAGQPIVDPRSRNFSEYRKPPTPLSRMQYPADTLYLTEFAEDPSSVLFNVWNATGTTDISIAQFYDIWDAPHINPLPINTNIRIFPKRHGEGCNAMFLDGHARAVPASFVTTLSNWDDRDYYRQP